MDRTTTHNQARALLLLRITNHSDGFFVAPVSPPASFGAEDSAATVEEQALRSAQVDGFFRRFGKHDLPSEAAPKKTEAS